jgi:hypothetical protein
MSQFKLCRVAAFLIVILNFVMLIANMTNATFYCCTECCIFIDLLNVAFFVMQSAAFFIVILSFVMLITVMPNVAVLF